MPASQKVDQKKFDPRTRRRMGKYAWWLMLAQNQDQFLHGWGTQEEAENLAGWLARYRKNEPVAYAKVSTEDYGRIKNHRVPCFIIGDQKMPKEERFESGGMRSRYQYHQQNNTTH